MNLDVFMSCYLLNHNQIYSWKEGEYCMYPIFLKFQWLLLYITVVKNAIPFTFMLLEMKYIALLQDLIISGKVYITHLEFSILSFLPY